MTEPKDVMERYGLATLEADHVAEEGMRECIRVLEKARQDFSDGKISREELRQAVLTARTLNKE